MPVFYVIDLIEYKKSDILLGNLLPSIEQEVAQRARSCSIFIKKLIGINYFD